MLASAVREAIISALKALTLAGRAGPGDKLTVLRVATEPDSVTERCAMVRLLGCGRDEATTCARFVVYQVVIFYPPSPDVDNRIADDSLVVDDAMWGLQQAEPDISSVEVTDTAVSEDAGRIATRRDLRVIYLHDEG